MTKSLNELFKKLSYRLLELRNYNFPYEIEQIGQLDFTVRLDEIFVEALDHPADDVLVLVNELIEQVQELERDGFSLLSNTEITDTMGLPVKLDKEMEAKEQIYQGIKKELEYYHGGLQQIIERIKKREPKLDRQLLQIDNNFEFPKLRTVLETKLDIYQTALLLHFMKEAQIIQPYDNMPLARIGAILTGHSEYTMAKNKGFGVIYDIMDDKKVNKNNRKGKNWNLNQVKSSLEEMLKLIDSEISKREKN